MRQFLREGARTTEAIRRAAQRGAESVRAFHGVSRDEARGVSPVIAGPAGLFRLPQGAAQDCSELVSNEWPGARPRQRLVCYRPRFGQISDRIFSSSSLRASTCASRPEICAADAALSLDNSSRSRRHSPSNLSARPIAADAALR